jgi:hypothetical protein
VPGPLCRVWGVEVGWLAALGRKKRNLKIVADVFWCRVFANFNDMQLRSQGQRYEILQSVNTLMERHRKGEKFFLQDWELPGSCLG